MTAPKHVTKTLDKFNKKYATHRNEVCPSKTGQKPRTGMWNAKKWVPEAVQRACFGIAKQQRRRLRWDGFRTRMSKQQQQRERGKRDRPANATAVSAGIQAAFMGASSSYVQKVRDACSEYLVTKVQDAYSRKDEPAELPKVALEIKTILCDETDFDVRVDRTRGTQHILMIAGNLFQRFYAADNREFGGSFEEEVMFPPAAVRDGTSKNVAQALAFRAGWFMIGTCALMELLIFLTDSAAALIKIGVHYVAQLGGLAANGTRLVWSGRCFMHKMWAAFVYATNEMAFISPMYCACHIMHKGGFMDKVRGIVHGEIRSRVRLVYDPPPEEQLAANRALFNLLSGYDREWDLGEILENDAYVNFKSQSTLSREFLLKHCVGPSATDAGLISTHPSKIALRPTRKPPN